MSAEIRLKRKQLQFERERYQMETLRELASNPVVEFAAGLMFIRWLTKDPDGKFNVWDPADLARMFQAGSAGMLLTGVISAQQISKALPYMGPVLDKLTPGLIGGLLK